MQREKSTSPARDDDVVLSSGWEEGDSAQVHVAQIRVPRRHLTSHCDIENYVQRNRMSHGVPKAGPQPAAKCYGYREPLLFEKRDAAIKRRIQPLAPLPHNPNTVNCGWNDRFAVLSKKLTGKVMLFSRVPHMKKACTSPAKGSSKCPPACKEQRSTFRKRLSSTAANCTDIEAGSIEVLLSQRARIADDNERLMSEIHRVRSEKSRIQKLVAAAETQHQVAKDNVVAAREDCMSEERIVAAFQKLIQKVQLVRKELTDKELQIKDVLKLIRFAETRLEEHSSKANLHSHSLPEISSPLDRKAVNREKNRLKEQHGELEGCLVILKRRRRVAQRQQDAAAVVAQHKFQKNCSEEVEVARAHEQKHLDQVEREIKSLTDMQELATRHRMREAAASVAEDERKLQDLEAEIERVNLSRLEMERSVWEHTRHKSHHMLEYERDLERANARILQKHAQRQQLEESRLQLQQELGSIRLLSREQHMQQADLQQLSVEEQQKSILAKTDALRQKNVATLVEIRKMEARASAMSAKKVEEDAEQKELQLLREDVAAVEGKKINLKKFVAALRKDLLFIKKQVEWTEQEKDRKIEELTKERAVASKLYVDVSTRNTTLLEELDLAERMIAMYNLKKS